jgi:hypothetical protein
MSALPPIEWGEEDHKAGAISFSQHIKEMMTAHSTTPSTADLVNKAVATVMPRLVEAIQGELSSTTTSSTSVVTATISPPTTPSTVEKISKVVVSVVPQLVETISEELSSTSTTAVPDTNTAVVPHTPPPTCGAPPEPQVKYTCIL